MRAAKKAALLTAVLCGMHHSLWNAAWSGFEKDVCA